MHFGFRCESIMGDPLRWSTAQSDFRPLICIWIYALMDNLERHSILIPRKQLFVNLFCENGGRTISVQARPGHGSRHRSYIASEYALYCCCQLFVSFQCIRSEYLVIDMLALGWFAQGRCCHLAVFKTRFTLFSKRLVFLFLIWFTV